MLTVRTYDDGEQFWRDVAKPLAARPVLNNVFVGVANRIRTDASRELLRAAVFDGPRVVLGALRTPPYRLNLADLGDGERGTEALAQHLAERRVDLPGVVGAVALGESFARHWTAIAGRTARPNTHHGWQQNLYLIEKAKAPANVAGRMRRAWLNERDLLVRWQVAFAKDADLPDTEQGADYVSRFVDDGLAEGTFVIWDVEGEPVSTARRRPIEKIGVRIGAVYTPNDRRGHGYAAALTAALAQAILDEDLFCCLFADAANPLTNRIYQRIGFAKVATFADIMFSDA
jgi:GNAT superfamily N-acetyltransferase